MEIRERLSQAMKANNMNARELSKRCGLSEASISRYLSGQMEPRANAVTKMAGVLHVDPMWLMSLDEYIDDSVEFNSISLLIEGLTPSEKEKVEAFIKFLISQRGGEDS